MKKYSFASLFAVFVVISGFTTPASAFELHNYQTGLCLSVGADNPNPGTAIVTWTCHGEFSQSWNQVFVTWNGSGWQYHGNFDFRADSDFILASDLRSLNTVLDLKNGVVQNGTPLVEEAVINGDAQQQWMAFLAFHDIHGTNCYFIENRASINYRQNYVMGVLGGNPNQGAQVVIWQLFTDANGNPDYVHHPDQYWCAY